MRPIFDPFAILIDVNRAKFSKSFGKFSVPLACMASLLFHSPLSASELESGLQARQFYHPDILVRQSHEPATQAQERKRAELARLGIDPAYAMMDQVSGNWATLILSRPLIPGSGVGNHLDWAGMADSKPHSSSELRKAALNAFLQYLDDNQAALGINPAEIGTDIRLTVHKGGSFIQIFAPRVFSGLPVRDSHITAGISHGNLVLYGTRNWGAIDVNLQPQVPSAEAIRVAEEHLGLVAVTARWQKGSLVIVPSTKTAMPGEPTRDQHLGWRLAWVLRASFNGSGLAPWEALVDAHSGELLSFEDADRRNLTRQVVGDIYPQSNDGIGPEGTQQRRPMPFAAVSAGPETFVTDVGGNMGCFDGEISTALESPRINMTDNCGALLESGTDPVLDLGGTDFTNCSVPIPGTSSPGNTNAARTTYYHVNHAIDWGRGFLPENAWLYTSLSVSVNEPSTCNAIGGIAGLMFYQEGNGCTNTGENGEIIVHEWAHALDTHDALPFFSNPDEGLADAYSALHFNSSCIGRGFVAGNCSGFGDQCLDCTGITDVDWAKRTSGVPHDISSPFPTGVDALCGGPGQPAPCGGFQHCEGALVGETIWDLANRDLIQTYGMNADTARELTTWLTFVGGGFVDDWYACVANFGGCGAQGGYLNFLFADEDNGNLTDGTPHMQAIFNAFDRHEIACNLPAVQDSGCAGTPQTAPVVAAEAGDKSVTLSWPSVAGAASYRILRSEGVRDCDSNTIPIANTTQTGYQDLGLANGVGYHYTVIPVGAGEQCMGPASACVSVTPVPAPNLAVDMRNSGSFTFSGINDGDMFLDNCERANVDISVVNTGSGAQSEIRIVSVTPLSHPEIQVLSEFPIPVSSNLAECDSATVPVEIYADGLANGDTVEFLVEVTSDNLQPAVIPQQVLIAPGLIEADSEFFASRTFSFESANEGWAQAEGIFARTNGAGAAGTAWFMQSSQAMNFACDISRSPPLMLASDSTLQVSSNYDIETMSGGEWYDRANVGVLNQEGTRLNPAPDSGILYNASGNYSGCNTMEAGWAGDSGGWVESAWSAAALGSSTLAGQVVNLEIIYSTDSVFAEPGFAFDEVTLTNVEVLSPDQMTNQCPGPAAWFWNGFER